MLIIFITVLFPPLPRPSGVVLMRPDYYTIPHLDEIDSLESEGQCVVEGFTIGRRGFGEVHFPGKTDVHGMNLDELGVCLSVCVSVCLCLQLSVFTIFCLPVSCLSVQVILRCWDLIFLSRFSDSLFCPVHT